MNVRMLKVKASFVIHVSFQWKGNTTAQDITCMCDVT